MKPNSLLWKPSEPIEQIVSDSYPKPKTETGNLILPEQVPEKLPQSSKSLLPLSKDCGIFILTHNLQFEKCSYLKKYHCTRNTPG